MTDHERATTRETRVSEPSRTVTSSTTDEPVTTVRTTDRSYKPAGPEGLSVVGRFVAFIFGVLQALLILRLVLLVLVANPGNDIVAFILSVTDPFVEPFRGMFALDRMRADQGSVLDVAALVALIGWTLIEALVLAALRIFARRPSEI
jgi:uncharacterized protein YggT (Ycf19 family)